MVNNFVLGDQNLYFSWLEGGSWNIFPPTKSFTQIGWFPQVAGCISKRKMKPEPRMFLLTAKPLKKTAPIFPLKVWRAPPRSAGSFQRLKAHRDQCHLPASKRMENQPISDLQWRTRNFFRLRLEILLSHLSLELQSFWRVVQVESFLQAPNAVWMTNCVHGTHRIDPSMVYLPIFTIKINQMQINKPYVDPMDI